jgi:hypothetical protein
MTKVTPEHVTKATTVMAKALEAAGADKKAAEAAAAALVRQAAKHHGGPAQ